MNITRSVRPFEIKSADGGPDGAVCTFEGLGAVCLNLDHTGDIVDAGAFTADLPWMLAEGKVRDEHCVTTGKIVAGSAGPEGLTVKGVVLDTSAGRDQAALLKGGAVTRLSMGYQVLARSWLNSPDEVKGYWQAKGYSPSEDDLLNLGHFGGARLLTRVKVAEVSTTWFPANDRAKITAVKGGTRAGRSFADHSEAVLATVSEYLDRAEGLARLRADSGRSLSQESKSRLTQLRGRLDALVSSLETKSDAATAPAESVADALYVQFLATLARLQGASV